MTTKTKEGRVGFSRTKKIVLSIFARVAIWAACLFGGNLYAVHAGYAHLSGLVRGERYDEALPAVAAGDLQAVLDKDIAEALKSGELAPSSDPGGSKLTHRLVEPRRNISSHRECTLHSRAELV